MSRAPRVAVLVVALLAVLALVVFDLDDPYDLWLGLVAGAGPLIMVAWFFLARSVDERLVSALAGPGAGGPENTTRDALRRVPDPRHPPGDRLRHRPLRCTRVAGRAPRSAGAVASPRSGLQGLVDRIDALGGEITIDSPPGLGTAVTACIPLAQNALTDDEHRRMTALRWFVHENWEMPGEVVDQIADEDNLIAGKVMLLAAGGNARITAREREWLVGYFTAARDADWVIEAVTTYDDSDTLEGLMQLPGIPETMRGMLYDGIRMCASDGPLTPDELSHLERSAATLGVAREEFDELCAIVAADAQLRRRRFNAIAAPVLPRGSSPSA